MLENRPRSKSILFFRNVVKVTFMILRMIQSFSYHSSIIIVSEIMSDYMIATTSTSPVNTRYMTSAGADLASKTASPYPRLLLVV